VRRGGALWLSLWLSLAVAQPSPVWGVPLPPAPAFGEPLARLADHPEGRERLWWELIGLFETHYWNPAHLDWRAWGARHRAPVRDAQGRAALDAALARMVREVGDGHSSFQGVRSLGPASVPGDAAPAWSAQMLHDGVGLLTIRTFQPQGMAAGVHAALRGLQAQGAEALLLDLRGNGGGRLLEAGLVAGIFYQGVWTEAWDTTAAVWEGTVRRAPAPTGGGERLIATLGRAGGAELGYAELIAPATFVGPLVVLVDRFTASAAELLALALVEGGRAQVVGERSAGNVEAVRPFRLSDGSQVLIAVAEMRSPTGLSVGRGVEPARVVLGPNVGWDAPVGEGLRLLRDLPFTPGRWWPPEPHRAPLGDSAGFGG
jgi:hypothetical protein